MLTQIPFIKMQALGNDFIIIHHKYQEYFLANNKEKIKLIANRTKGITIASANSINNDAPHFAKEQVGADQIIFYDIKNEEQKIISISIFNQDGSGANACGNGFRCLGKYFWKEKNWDSLTIQVQEHQSTYTVQRIKNPSYKLNSADDEYTINMGFITPESYNPKLYLNILNVLEKSNISPILLEKITKHKKLIRYVYAPNPHLVLFIDNTLSKEEIITSGKILEPANINNNLSGQNINFVKILNEDNIQVSTFERGTGLTKACGTGAVASFCASFANYMESTNNTWQNEAKIPNPQYPFSKINPAVTIHMVGGELKISRQNANNTTNILMQGLATTVFKGNIPYN